MYWFKQKGQFDLDKIYEIIDKLAKKKTLDYSEELLLNNFLMYETKKFPGLRNWAKTFERTFEELVIELVEEIWDSLNRGTYKREKAGIKTFMAIRIREHLSYLRRKYKRKRVIPRSEIVSLFGDVETEFEEEGIAMIEKLEEKLPSVEEREMFKDLWNKIKSEIKTKSKKVQDIFKAKTEGIKGREELRKDVELAKELKISSNEFRSIISKDIIPIIEKYVKEFKSI